MCNADIEKLEQCILCGKADFSKANYAADRCKHCGHVFINPRPTQNAIAKHYSTDNQYDSWLEVINHRKVLWNRRVQRLLKYAQSGKLLDIGAGLGEFVSQASEHFDTTGTEVSQIAAEYGKQELNLNIMLTSLEDAKFQDEEFDVVTMWHVLEHVPYPGETIVEIMRILKPGGMFFIAVPNASWWTWSHLMMIPRNIAKLGMNMLGKKYFYDRLYPAIRLKPGEEIHLSYFTPAILKNYLSANGFEVLELGLDSYPANFHFFRRLLFGLCNTFNNIFGKNLYPAIFLAAKKK